MEANEIIEMYKKLAEETKAPVTTFVAGIKFVFSSRFKSGTRSIIAHYVASEIRHEKGAEELLTTCLKIQRDR